ncbi:MAG: cupin domain-containing protein, partial [Acetatifactor sp.]|nr:cupin domain-containing protein [Acetatifactor sp.]
MFVKNEACKVTPCEPGVTRRVMAYSDQLMMCEITFEKGAEGIVHKPHHEQISDSAEGSFL